MSGRHRRRGTAGHGNDGIAGGGGGAGGAAAGGALAVRGAVGLPPPLPPLPSLSDIQGGRVAQLKSWLDDQQAPTDGRAAALKARLTDLVFAAVPTRDEVNRMLVAPLRALLSRHDLDTGGTSADLKRRAGELSDIRAADVAARAAAAEAELGDEHKDDDARAPPLPWPSVNAAWSMDEEALKGVLAVQGLAVVGPRDTMLRAVINGINTAAARLAVEEGAGARAGAGAGAGAVQDNAGADKWSAPVDVGDVTMDGQMLVRATNFTYNDQAQSMLRVANPVDVAQFCRLVVDHTDIDMPPAFKTSIVDGSATMMDNIDNTAATMFPADAGGAGAEQVLPHMIAKLLHAGQVQSRGGADEPLTPARIKSLVTRLFPLRGLMGFKAAENAALLKASSEAVAKGRHDEVKDIA